MKIKTSITALRKAYPHYKIFRCGYCDLQSIVSSSDYQFYNAGIYGWNCDILVSHTYGIIITTGYRNMRGEMIPSELITKYSEICRDIRSDNTLTLSQQVESIDFTLEQFLCELSHTGA